MTFENSVIKTRRKIFQSDGLPPDDVIITVNEFGEYSTYLVPIVNTRHELGTHGQEFILKKLEKRDFNFLNVPIRKNEITEVYYAYFNFVNERDTLNIINYPSRTRILKLFDKEHQYLGAQVFQIAKNKILIFDTETTGLPNNWNAPISDLSNWPRLVQLAYLIYDEEKNLLKRQNYIVKPLDFIIPSNATKIHGISNETAQSNGIEIWQVLEEFNSELLHVDEIVAHNLSYDEKIIESEYYRLGLKPNFLNKNKICTKELSTNYCDLPDNKWPTLDELYFKLFNKNIIITHNALDDILVVSDCYWELKKIGVIEN